MQKEGGSSLRKPGNSTKYTQAEDWDDFYPLPEANSEPYGQQKRTDSLSSFLDADFWNEQPSTPPKRKKKDHKVFLTIAMSIILVVTAAILWKQLPQNANNTTSAATAPVATTPIVTSPVINQQPTLPTSPPTETQPYVTPVPIVELRYFGEKLTDQEKLVYYQLVDALSEYQTTIELQSMSEESDLSMVIGAVLQDYPEFFWCSGSCTWEYFQVQQTQFYTITFDYRYSVEEAREHNAFVEALIQPVLDELQDKTDYEKVKGVYEYLIEHTVYDLDYLGTSVYELFHDGKAVCEGYARATQLLLNKLEVEAIYVEGSSDNGSGSGSEGHAWNIVKIDGAYYQLDTTWGDPISDEQIITYNYFNLTDAEFFKDHQPDDPSLYPTCNSSEYNYFRYEGYYLESFDKAKLSVWIQEAQETHRRVSFRCSDESLYRQVKTWLFDNGGVWELCPDMGGYSFGSDDNLFILDIAKT